MFGLPYLLFMNRKYLLLASFFLLTIFKGLGQTKDSTAVLKFSGYVDAYYAYYTDSVGTGNFQKFPTVSPRTEQFGLNIAMLSLQYDAAKVRGVISVHYGDIPLSTWSPTFKNIQEAHAGLRLLKWLWLDAGFFRTHFGTEGLLPKENITSSVSVDTYSEPYFESGARLQILAGKSFTVNLFALNGYNIYEDNNHKKSFGALLTYAPEDSWNIGYSNYIGDDSPDSDSISHLRIEQNIFINYQFHNFKIQAGVDYCMQEHSSLEDQNKMGSMYSGIFSVKYSFSPQFSIYGRGEVFDDPDGFMSTLFLDNANKYTGYVLWGGTAGFEFKPTENAYIRIEGRNLYNDQNQKIYYWKGKYESHRQELMCNAGISF